MYRQFMFSQFLIHTNYIVILTILQVIDNKYLISHWEIYNKQSYNNDLHTLDLGIYTLVL